MSQTLSIPANDQHRLHLFALNMLESDARKLAARPDAASELLGVAVDPDYAEIIRIADLDDLGLAGYLGEGYDVSPDILRQQAQKIGAVEGYALIVLSRAIGRDAAKIKIGAAMTYIDSYLMRSPDWTGKRELVAKAATPGTAPPETHRKRPSDAAMMGRVATIVLIVLFALTGLLVWIAA